MTVLLVVYIVGGNKLHNFFPESLHLNVSKLPVSFCLVLFSLFQFSIPLLSSSVTKIQTALETNEATTCIVL